MQHLEQALYQQKRKFRIMKQHLEQPLLFAMALVITACSGNEKGNGKSEPTDNKAPAATAISPRSNRAQAVLIKNDPLNAIYQQYIQLSAALSNGEVGKAKIASNAIEAGTRELPGGSTLAMAAAKVTSAAGIEAQRIAFSSLSGEMVKLIKKAGLDSGEIYVDFCPMALNDKGAYWLSSGKEIRNPYFGDQMLTCGEIKETLK